MTKPVIVMKFGGSSLADVNKVRKVAELVTLKNKDGYNVVVVVSAQGKTTDSLMQMAKDISSNPHKRELDMLLTVGERVSMALLSMAIRDLGYESISLTGSQCGIITNDVHVNARIIEVRPYRIEDELEKGKIVIVAGFQGISYKKEITTLGRGGSDTTAVSLAAALNAKWCEIYSDVDGVYTGDPIIVNPEHLPELTYDEMLEMSYRGAKVLSYEAVEFAKKKNIAIYARSSKGGQKQTTIRKFFNPNLKPVIAVSSVENLKCFFAKDFILLKKFYTHATKQNIRIRFVVSNENGFKIYTDTTEEIFIPEFKSKSASSISLIGNALHENFEVMDEVFKILEQHSIKPAVLETASSHLTLYLQGNIPSKSLISDLHDKFINRT